MKEKEKNDLATCVKANITNEMLEIPIYLRPFEQKDTLPICSWVKTTEELTNISGDTAKYLTEDILDRWCDESIVSLVLQCWGKPIAFCTLSTKEYDLPEGFVEICHLIIAPNQRRKYYATTFVNYLRLIAAQLNFQKLIGRIVRDNLPALKLAEYIRWNEVKDTPHIFSPQFRWYSYELRK